jgi:hypothetical protein
LFFNYRSKENLYSTFSRCINYVHIYFDKKWVGLHFGRLFYKLIYVVTMIKGGVLLHPRTRRVSSSVKCPRPNQATHLNWTGLKMST